jgi:Holliday junction resolvasome RuvABC endonuclease subunit
MNIVALDIATTTGWAANLGNTLDYDSEELVTRPTLRLARKQRLDRRLDSRVVELYNLVLKLAANYRADLIVFEDVLFIKSREQAHLWASLRAAVWLAAKHSEIQTDCLNTTALKMFATGMPGAKKERMLEALKKAEPTLDFARMDDNMVDAIWLWSWAQRTFRAFNI